MKELPSREDAIKPQSGSRTEMEAMMDMAVTAEDENDPLVSFMRKNGIPLTLEKYLTLAYGSDQPEEFGAEELAEIPLCVRDDLDEDEKRMLRGED